MLDTQLCRFRVLALHQGPSVTERWGTTRRQTVKPSAMPGLCFPLSAREEREDSSPWEVRGAFLRGSQSCGWTWVVFLSSSLKGHWAALEASRWSIHSPCLAPCLSFTCCIFDKQPNHMAKIKISVLLLILLLKETGLHSIEALPPLPGWVSPTPQCSRDSHANLQPHNSFKLFFFTLFLGGKENETWYTTLLGFFVVFIKFFKISQNYTH